MYNEPSFLEQALAAAALSGILLTLIATFTGVICLFLGLIFYFTFNHGLIPIINQLGGDASGITYWTAFFGCWFVSLIGTLTKGTTVNSSS